MKINEILWHIRRTKLGKTLSSDDVASNYKTHDGALKRLKEISKEKSVPITEGLNGAPEIVTKEDGEDVVYWIYGRSPRLGESAPNLIEVKSD